MNCHNIIENEDRDIEIINISKKFNLSQILDKLQENDSLVFYSEKKLYFMKNGILKTADYISMESLTPACKDVKINSDLMNQSFFMTNKTINNIISSIRQEEVSKYLNEGYTLIYVNAEASRGWTIWLEEGLIKYSTDAFECDNKDYHIYFVDDLLNSFIAGQWFIADNSSI